MRAWADIARSMPVKQAEPRYVDLEFHARAGVPTMSVTVVAEPPTLRWRLRRRARWCLEQVETIAPAAYWSLRIVERIFSLVEVQIANVRSLRPRL